MAEASKETIKVAKPIEYEHREVVNLQISVEEAQFLAAMMGRVGGSPENSMRKYSDSITKALKPIVGARKFSEDAWFDNGYDWDTRAHFSFGANTNSNEHTIRVNTFDW